MLTSIRVCAEISRQAAKYRVGNACLYCYGCLLPLGILDAKSRAVQVLPGAPRRLSGFSTKTPLWVYLLPYKDRNY